MKTFKQLAVGDTFYKVFTNYAGRAKPTFDEIKINRIQAVEERGEQRFQINSRNGYSGGYTHDLNTTVEESSTDTIQNSEGYYTTDYVIVVKLLKEAALSFIKEEEAHIKKHQKAIEDIRIAYWDYLNNLTETPILEAAQ